MTQLVSGLVTEQDLADYDRDGAIMVRGAVSAAWIERLRADIPRAIEGMLRMREAMGRPRPEGPAHHDVLMLFKRDPLWRAFALESGLALLAADVMQSSKVIVFGDHLLVKEPGTQNTTPWHHDLPYWPIRGPRMASIWVALDSVRLETGALEYIAGSHKWGRWFKPVDFMGKAEIPGADLETIPDFDAERAQHRIISWDLEPGDVLVHHPLVVHGAGANSRTDRARRAISIRYVGDETRFVGSSLMGGNEGPFALPLQPGDPVEKDDVHPTAWVRDGADA
ncbi:phytanoyl-CoA dioxygenase family protein [Novosphingobium sp. BL-52-GroH]|uniref:phytanoyl-CoA dioxygenase family protein n=1 Tax=Novosphingobium sp. BL-52-GroH TaxID=3349877 RepID=UPI00384C4E1C